MTESRLVFGCMTGTSIDALDAAAVRLEGRGLGVRARVVACAAAPLGALAPRLRSLASGEAMTAGEAAGLARDLGVAHADALLGLAGAAGRPDFVAVHGQTVFHSPPLSWQMLNPWPIARSLGCPVVHDLRGADLAAGGQGAPITPLADWVFFRAGETRAVVNLGGFCNVTILPGGAEPGAVLGMDVCACNHVLDAVARTALGRPYDNDGEAALRGSADSAAVRSLRDVLGAQRIGGRSLGTGDEIAGWVSAWKNRLAAEDLAASAALGVGEVIGGAVAEHRAALVLVAGGGARNGALVSALRRAAGAPLRPTDSEGVPVTHREAAQIAVLGALCADGVAITLPKVTGVPAPAPISGAWINTRPTQ